MLVRVKVFHSDFKSKTDDAHEQNHFTKYLYYAPYIRLNTVQSLCTHARIDSQIRWQKERLRGLTFILRLITQSSALLRTKSITPTVNYTENKQKMNVCW